MKFGLMVFFLIMNFHGAISLAQEKTSYCIPGESCWPTQAQWNELSKQVNGHLSKGLSPLLHCTSDSKSTSCQKILAELKNPYFIESKPWATQSNGWLGAWNSAVSSYAIAVENAEEIAHAVNFARQHRLKLVIKGTGHDYLGRSNAPNSLLVWTHPMRKVTFQEHFVPQGCLATYPSVMAVTAEAGARWLEAYNEVTTKHGRYVQGGGCTTVGVAGGFIQGGGFGSFSKKFGTGASGILEAEIVTADGNIRIANACQNQDLYWALKGGGGGTFGIVSKITLKTHALPAQFGHVKGFIKAKSNVDYKNLIAHFINFYREHLHNEHWGEQITLSPNNEMQFALAFQGMDKNEVNRLWQPFKNWLSEKPEHYQFSLNSASRAAKNFWDFDYLIANQPESIVINKQKHVPSREFWWASNQPEVSMYLTHYLSFYLPITLFSANNANHLAGKLFDASRLTDISLHFNKGLSGASLEAVERQKNTAMNPKVMDAAALVIIAGGQQNTYPDINGYRPDLIKAKQAIKKANQAINLLYALSPDLGTYPNEADYFLKNWQSALWGRNYPKLLQIKHKYDPQNLFTCHHCVGSEEDKI